MDTTMEALAQTALQELLEVSPQVEAALVADLQGATLASAGTTASDRLAALVLRVLDTAERSRKELGREPVTQCEIGTGDGSLFVVRDAHHVVAAVTGLDPTVGLVFYDLKTALRTLRDATTHVTAAGNGTSAAATSETTEGAGA